MQAGIMMSRQLPFVKGLLARYSKPTGSFEEFAENQTLQIKICELKKTLDEFKQETELIDGLERMLKNANDVGLRRNDSVTSTISLKKIGASTVFGRATSRMA